MMVCMSLYDFVHCTISALDMKLSVVYDANSCRNHIRYPACNLCINIIYTSGTTRYAFIKGNCNDTITLSV